MSDAGLSEAFLSQSPACYWIVDTDQAFRHIYGDTSSLLGKSAAELAGRPVAEALEPELYAKSGS